MCHQCSLNKAIHSFLEILYFRKGKWSVCPKGYFLNGLYRSRGNRLRNIEAGKCCKPVNHPNKYGSCHYQYVKYKLSKKGWVTCNGKKFYITGFKRDCRGSWLHDIAVFKCCEMWIGENDKSVFHFYNHFYMKINILTIFLFLA